MITEWLVSPQLERNELDATGIVGSPKRLPNPTPREGKNEFINIASARNRRKLQDKEIHTVLCDLGISLQMTDK